MPLPVLLGLLFLIVAAIGYVLSRGGSESAVVAERLEALATEPDMGGAAALRMPGSKGAKKQTVFSEMDKAFEKRDFYSRMILEFQKADLQIRYTEYVALCVGAAGMLGGIAFLLTKSPVLGIMLAIIGSILPRFYVKFRQTMRVRNIDTQLVDALILVSNALKSGYSFLQGIELVAEEAPEPISVEFRRMLREVNLGLPVEEALDHITDRVPSEDLDLVVTSVKIQRTVGGNLAEVIDKIVHTIRERIRIKGEIATLTAQGKLQGIILTLLPPAMMLGIYGMAPDFMSPLFTTLPGKLMLAWAFLLQLMGGFMIFKIVDIKV
ncbi:MAG: hypothetical protein GEEBNDBF_00022 [bacterium]|nr:hypothetical protein [bacterium]